MLNDAQLDRLMDAIRSDEEWGDFFLLELTTGPRRGEICGFKSDDFDEESNKLKINRSISYRKGGDLYEDKPKTQEDYENRIYLHIIPHLGNVPLKSLTQIDLQKFYNKLKTSGRLQHTDLFGKGLSARVIRGCHSTCRTALQAAVEQGIIRKNPAIGCITKINDHLYEGRYSHKGADGKRISKNVYAQTETECEEKLAELIRKMKAEIAAEKAKTKTTE